MRSLLHYLAVIIDRPLHLHPSPTLHSVTDQLLGRTMAYCCLQGGLVLHLPSGSNRTYLAADGSRGRRQGRSIRVLAISTGRDLRLGLDDNPEGILSGEWPDNFSLLSYDDFRAFLEAQAAAAKKMRAFTSLGEIMSTPVRAAATHQTLEEIDHHFQFVSGLPVVDGQLRCVGVVCHDDTARALHGLETKIAEFMSSPAITLTPNRTVKDAAALMLKMKINRIPIIDEDGRLVGIVTRTDVSQAMQTHDE